MSTRAIIGFYTDSNQTDWQGVYTHSDGDPKWTGRVLLEAFQHFGSNVERLISFAVTGRIGGWYAFAGDPSLPAIDHLEYEKQVRASGMADIRFAPAYITGGAMATRWLTPDSRLVLMEWAYLIDRDLETLNICSVRDGVLSAAYSLPLASAPLTYEQWQGIEQLLYSRTDKPNESLYLSVADTAKLVRAALKTAFPNVPARSFSVKSDSYSGGASIRVSWRDGYTVAEVEAVVQQFSGSTFDAMQDLKEYHTSIDANGRKVHYGADHILTERDYSPEFITAIVELICAQRGIDREGVIITASSYDGSAQLDSTRLDHDRDLYNRLGGRYVGQFIYREASKISEYAAPESPVPDPTPTPLMTTDLLLETFGDLMPKSSTLSGQLFAERIQQYALDHPLSESAWRYAQTLSLITRDPLGKVYIEPEYAKSSSDDSVYDKQTQRNIFIGSSAGSNHENKAGIAYWEGVKDGESGAGAESYMTKYINTPYWENYATGCERGSTLRAEAAADQRQQETTSEDDHEQLLTLNGTITAAALEALDSTRPDDTSTPPACVLCGLEGAPADFHIVKGQQVCPGCYAEIEAYADKRLARLERMRAAADRLNNAGEAAIAHASKLADIIPFGEPIHIGHYSEQRDRNFRERIHKTFGRGFEAIKQAKDLERRADNAEANDAISSDDPGAILKLQAKIAALQMAQVRMVDINKTVRAVLKSDNYLHDRPEKLALSAGISIEEAVSLLKRDYMGRTGYPAWQLSNNSANINRLKARLEQLQTRAAARAAMTETVIREQVDGLDLTIERDHDENRLRLLFPGKPASTVISTLKQWGFRWSPTNKAWQRQLNNGAEYAAEQVIAFIRKTL